MNDSGRSINKKTLISTLLKEDKEGVIKALECLNKNFAKLRNPVLRNMFAGFVTIETACKVGNCEVTDFLDVMKKIGFMVEEDPANNILVLEDDIKIDKSNIKELDVRAILSRQEDPLKLIMSTVKELQDSECLKLIAPFEPVPLIHLMQAKGFSNEVHIEEDGSVITYFKRDYTLQKTVEKVQLPVVDDPDSFNLKIKHFEGKIKTLDVRDLEMPKPMIAILETLQQLGDGEALYVYHKKIPVYLLPHLEEKGFLYLTKNTDEGKVDLLIYKS
ncbi:hypothetical protein ADIARSV_0353 [Arcticibacter svalbardensis MN12-7]|uniref:DUF2249 domain-containing protein n=1 Tax=Arcticibacter svalbardensis MN12-7 TaxID=1150600 RepID=R9GY60_9SPHI|nr:DUF2249 domain-containing protein [Arcticibacter svalbardensis]EOR96450.1 hypothetical protein ADIARSV_0353 [Arcticibacter svalbardensis MN12-7]